jgi:hypothetical protein
MSSPLQALAMWENDRLIGEPAKKLLTISQKHGNPEMPFAVKPTEYDIPFQFRYDPEDEACVQKFRRLGVLFAALDIHCYWRDGKQVIGVVIDPTDAKSKAWSQFSEEAMEIILAFVTSRDWT